MAVVRTFRVHSIGHFVHPCFLLSSWEQCYAIPLHAPNSSEIHPNNCLPPERKRVRGRPKGTRAKSQRIWRICCRGLEDVRTVGALVILLVTVKMEDHESLMQGEFIWTLRLGTLKFNLLLWLVVGCVSCSMLH